MDKESNYVSYIGLHVQENGFGGKEVRGVLRIKPEFADVAKVRPVRPMGIPYPWDQDPSILEFMHFERELERRMEVLASERDIDPDATREALLAVQACDWRSP